MVRCTSWESVSTWNTAAFPAVLANCQACHTGSVANVDNWKSVPSRAACGSCHDLVNFATGVNHGAYTTDDVCNGCHPATGGVLSVTSAHDWTKKDIRNIPEFDIALTVNTPARGYFVNGESPVISIALKDAVTKAVIVPNTVIQDNTGSEGCIPNAAGTACTVPRDNLFTAASVYVTGPRGQRVPVLTYAARAKVTSTSAGPWNLSALSASARALRVKVDGGMSMLTYNNDNVYEGYGADELITGDITVTLPADNTLTVDNVVNLLNANPTFHERAIAYVEDALNNPAFSPDNNIRGRLSIRSRGVLARNKSGEVTKTAAQRNVLVVTSPAGMFTANQFGFSGTSASVRIINTFTTATGGFVTIDPKTNFTDPTAIKYTLDPVDDLAPGTYGINVEYADAGRGAEPTPPPASPLASRHTPTTGRLPSR